MSAPRYLGRQLTPKQRVELLAWRKERAHPWHSLPHRPNSGQLRYLISAACFEHRQYIGQSPERLDTFTQDLLAVLSTHTSQIISWCVLPNHYHLLVETPDLEGCLHKLGRFHGRTSHAWNSSDDTRGRKVFFRALERAMRSDRHFWATVNYVHHNAVRHGYVRRWTDWRWSSATEYLARTGVNEAKRIWCDYPIHEYGAGWDEPAM
jgi:putative transposase